MKTLIFSSLLLASSLAAAADWKVVAETVNCDEHIQVHAKEGEKYVLVNGEKLFSEEGEAYVKDSPTNTVFSSRNYSFTQPSMVEGNPPKIDVHSVEKRSHCRMTAK